MPKNTNDRQVKISISLPGQYIELKRDRSGGDNPRFFASQVEEILDAIRAPLREMIAAEHGVQHTFPRPAETTAGGK
jgi:hypothetical protein